MVAEIYVLTYLLAILWAPVTHKRVPKPRVLSDILPTVANVHHSTDILNEGYHKSLGHNFIWNF